MDGGNEERVAIKFCFKASLSATETLVSLQKAYGNDALNRSNVFRWYSRFQGGRELVEYDERGGRPTSTQTEVNTAAVADLVIKAASVCQFFTPKMLQPCITPCTLHIYLRQTIFCSPN